MTTATVERRKGEELLTATVDPAPPIPGEDGYPVREWVVDGELVRLSLKPYPEEERPVYWYPKSGHQGQLMNWRSQTKDARGYQPRIQQERWVAGKFAPRNDWEHHMTREFLRSDNLDPEKCKGTSHPDGPGHVFRCGDCSYVCPNWHVFEQHQRRLSHTGMRSEVLNV